MQKHEVKIQELAKHKSENDKKPSSVPQLERDFYHGVHLAHCIDTRDPLKQGRVRYYSPILHLPDAPLDGLDWAWPISSMGGFDDCGLNWVPPAGSTLCLLFQNGSPNSAFYVGTTWHRDRGPVSNRKWGVPIPEFERVSEGHRGGYMVGKDDESQVFPPWNTDQYQGYDLDDQDYDNQIDAQVKVTWPHAYGFKTPEKHFMRMDDGDPKCNRRWKRLEIQSSLGHYFIMKDDPYHPAGEWLNPRCTDPDAQDEAPEICTGTVYCQWQILAVSIITDLVIQITVNINDAPCAAPADGEIVAIGQVTGIEGIEGMWQISGSGAIFTLDGSQGEEVGGGFVLDDSNPEYVIKIDEGTDGPVLIEPATCSQGPESCPVAASSTEIDGIQMGYVDNVSLAPTTITSTTPHNLSTGARLTIAGVSGISGINSSWTITVTSTTQFTLDGANPTASPAYVAGSGIWLITVENEYLGTEHLCPPHAPPSNLTGPKLGPCRTLLHRDYTCRLDFRNQGKNKYQKHQQECYPILGGRCALRQSGIQLLARSGATLIMDDSVEEPRGIPHWEQSLSKFDKDGCTGVFKGRTLIASATDHTIELNDEENQPGVRGPDNGINLQTASGNYIRLSDHSKPCCQAGDYRGVHIGSTARHTLDMTDAGNQQCSDKRVGCGKPAARASNAYVRLRSGYGLSLLFSDGYSQTGTNQQYIQLNAPQTDNTKRGPHVLHMQEKADGPGQLFLRAGGDLIVYSYDNMVDIVGDAPDSSGGGGNPANKLSFVSGRRVLSTTDYYYSKAKTHVFWSDDHIFLLAGSDCEGQEGAGPCVYPVAVACQPIPDYITQMTGIKASDRVFASAKACESC